MPGLEAPRGVSTPEEEMLEYCFVLEKEDYSWIPEYDPREQVIKASRMRAGKPDRYGYLSISAQQGMCSPPTGKLSNHGCHIHRSTYLPTQITQQQS
jgi:hypothetical protein